MMPGSQSVLLEVVSVLGKRIRLTRTQWQHVIEKHREIDSQMRLVETTLTTPDFVLYSPSEDYFQYYGFHKGTPVSDKHLLVVAKHLNDEGFVITTFLSARSDL